MSTLIFDLSHAGRYAGAQCAKLESLDVLSDLPQEMLRSSKAQLPEVSELDALRHYTRLSQRNFSIDTHFYPLGSCTMKYNPRGVHRMAFLPGFLNRHPLAPDSHSQGLLACLYDLQNVLQTITGMDEVSLSPMAGAQGEFAGVAMIKAYHASRGDHARTEMLVPDAAHGTNPASAIQCGFTVKEIPTDERGNIRLDALQAALSEKTAGIMLTNPSTLGVFEEKILDISRMVHAAGGLLYYDGANFNAIMGKARPGDMGFDVVHLNLHKTFATPHGGGGPGSGPVAASARLRAFLPVPRVIRRKDGSYGWMTKAECPESIGRLSAFMGNAGILLRAYAYATLLGRTGLQRVSEFACLNASYLQAKLAQHGFTLAFPMRRATHEFIITLKHESKTIGVSALDVAKRLLDFGFHAPTMYFPLLVPECLLVEPTETESKQVLDQFADTLLAILEEARHNPGFVKNAPYTLPVKRLDDVKAARDLNLVHPHAHSI